MNVALNVQYTKKCSCNQQKMWKTLLLKVIHKSFRIHCGRLFLQDSIYLPIPTHELTETLIKKNSRSSINKENNLKESFVS